MAKRWYTVAGNDEDGENLTITPVLAHDANDAIFRATREFTPDELKSWEILWVARGKLTPITRSEKAKLDHESFNIDKWFLRDGFVNQPVNEGEREGEDVGAAKRGAD